jgi:two-component system nitrate/nitrite response regulator NarL
MTTVICNKVKVIKVLLIEDHEVVRAGLRMLIESWPSFVVVGEASNRDQALKLVSDCQLDIILLDIDLGCENGLDFLPELLARNRNARVLVLTAVEDPKQHERAILSGAMGVVQKSQAASVLLKAIEKVDAGEVWINRCTMARVLIQMSQRPDVEEVDPEAPKISKLTVRERSIISLICEGLPNRQIASRLVIGETTVRHHLTTIFEKLNLQTRLELAIYAHRHGLDGE